MIVKINSVYDFYSSIVLLYNYDYIYRFLVGKYKYFIQLYIILLLERFMKYIFSFPSYDILKRPDGAFNCGLTNLGGDVSGQCGFPSGHVITTSYYFYLLFLENRFKSKKYKKFNYLFLILIQIPIFLVSYGRLMKKCHNLFQVSGGYIFGMFLAFLFY
tara:strand:- start:306 stop:782 length:477 start_codon:yes stop_codon:yes gene_type:complete